MADEQPRPIIIKRTIVSEEQGHHGGAWKVAYADFVTAMMAFFLLMWLLNATTEKQRKGLADYFAPSIPISRVSGGGEGAFWGDSVFAEDTLVMDRAGAASVHAVGDSPAQPERAARTFADGPASAGAGNRTGAERLLSELEARGGESMAALREMRHVTSRLTEEGLVIDIYEKPGVVLFGGADGNTPTPVLHETLALVAEAFKIVANDVAVATHVPALPIVRTERPVWEITTARALAVREAVERAGLPPARLRKVTGYADRDPMESDPLDIRNGRVEIVLLRDDV